MAVTLVLIGLDHPIDVRKVKKWEGKKATKGVEKAKRLIAIFAKTTPHSFLKSNPDLRRNFKKNNYSDNALIIYFQKD